MKHTPGPWAYKFAENGGYDCMTDAFHIHASENPFIVTAIDLSGYGQRCDPPLPDARDRAEADSRLIAAAPDLLAALKLAIAWIEDHDCPHAQDALPLALSHGREVIAKAEGR